MYVCNNCCDEIDKNLKERFFSMSYGLCEVCSKPHECFDIHHSYLPPFTMPQEREYEPVAGTVSVKNGHAQMGKPLARLVAAALEWRKRSDSTKNAVELALAVDAYKRSKTT